MKVMAQVGWSIAVNPMIHREFDGDKVHLFNKCTHFDDRSIATEALLAGEAPLCW